MTIDLPLTTVPQIPADKQASRKRRCYDYYGQVGDGDTSQWGKYEPVAVAGDRTYLQP